MSLRQLGASVHFAPGVGFAVIRRPPRATHVAVYCFPCPNEEWPIPAGYGPRSHPLLHFLDTRVPGPNDVAPPDVDDNVVIGQIDFTTSTDLYGQPIRLPSDCEAVSIENGNAAGSTDIIRGRAFWFEERVD